ncbi:hypothetical protein GOV09_01855 [Candidatus Woesearchaeota archaeon]|nr:hypothetical protein [Candidatus Woesearchaeota archaeon]
MYKRTQIGYLILFSFLITIALIFYLSSQEEAPVEWLVGFFFLLIPLFSTLTVSVTDRITVRFGIGLIRKNFVLEDIVSCKQVRNRWWYGWGIRYFGRGWLYNIHGLDAVELQFKNGKVARIGTAEPDKLCNAIKMRLRSP